MEERYYIEKIQINEKEVKITLWKDYYSELYNIGDKEAVTEFALTNVSGHYKKRVIKKNKWTLIQMESSLKSKRDQG